MHPPGPRFDFERNEWVGAPNAARPDLVRHEPPAPGRWTKPPPPEVPNRWIVPGVVALLVSLIVAAFALQSPLPLLGVGACVVLARDLPKTRRVSERKITDADRRMIEDPDDKDVCLVLITIVRDWRTVGEDKGVVWFADGRIFFSGHRTSFVLGGEDLLPKERWSIFASTEGGLVFGDRTLPLDVDRGNAYVSFQALSYGDAREMRFSKRLTAFLKNPPQSRGPRQWPPFEPYG